MGVTVPDIDAATAFFAAALDAVFLYDVRCRTEEPRSTPEVHGYLGIPSTMAQGAIRMLALPEGPGLELFEYLHPAAIETEPTRPNEIGMHRVAFAVDDMDDALEIAARHGCHPLRGVATYEEAYKLTYVRGPSGILVMFAEELKQS